MAAGVRKPRQTKRVEPEASKPEEAAEAMEAAGLGLSRSDFSDDGADLEELKEILEGGN